MRRDPVAYRKRRGGNESDRSRSAGTWQLDEDPKVVKICRTPVLRCFVHVERTRLPQPSPLGASHWVLTVTAHRPHSFGGGEIPWYALARLTLAFTHAPQG